MGSPRLLLVVILPDLARHVMDERDCYRKSKPFSLTFHLPLPLIISTPCPPFPFFSISAPLDILSVHLPLLRGPFVLVIQLVFEMTLPGSRFPLSKRTS